MAMTHSLQASKEKAGFIDMFLKAVSIHPDAVAVEFDGSGRKITYSGLLSMMENFKAIFEKMGVRENEMVILQLPSGAEFIAALYALASCGAIALPVSSELTHYEMGLILDNSKPVGVVTTDVVYSYYSSLFNGRSLMRFALSVTGPAAEAGDNTIQLLHLSAWQGIKSQLEAPSGNPVVTCHYTNRGCGVPLGVPHRYQDYTTCVEGMGSQCPLFPDASVVIGLPIYHIYGSIMVVFGLSFGGRLVIVPKFMERNFVDIMEQHRAVLITFVPIILPKLLLELKERGGRNNIDFHPNLFISSSSTSVPRELHDEIAELSGFEILQGYGLTEGLSITSAYRGIEAERGTQGVPIHDDVTVKIVDGKGDEVPSGKMGEIVIGGPTVTEGFFDRPEINATFFKGGCFHTGDLGWIDRNGFLTFEGRSLPVAKVAGHMVDLLEVETVMNSHPNVIKVRAIEKRMPAGRNYVSVSVLATKRSNVNQKSLQGYCRNFLSLYKVPSEIKILKHEGHGSN